MLANKPSSTASCQFTFIQASGLARYTNIDTVSTVKYQLSVTDTVTFTQFKQLEYKQAKPSSGEIIRSNIFKHPTCRQLHTNHHLL